ncbi:hypothetical protein F7U66_00995 [Vibrio parahaemolyticus]|nr:hypothetical protein [Vibrio parahaemolyticus]
MDIKLLMIVAGFICGCIFLVYQARVYMRYENAIARQAKRTVAEWNVVYRDFVNSCANYDQELQVSLAALTREEAVTRYPTISMLFESREKRDNCIKGGGRVEFLNSLREDYLHYKHSGVPMLRPGINMPTEGLPLPTNAIPRFDSEAVLGLRQNIPS